MRVRFAVPAVLAPVLAVLLLAPAPARAQGAPWWAWFLPRDNASIVRHDIPAVMTADAEVDVVVEVRNTGRDVWRPPGYRLGAVGDVGGDAARFLDVHGDIRVQIPGGVSVGYRRTHAFRFRLRAPSQPGVYFPQFRMVHEGVRWFGGTAGRAVRVDPNPTPPPPPPPPPPQFRGRPGLVRLSGNCLEDDAGRFNALGATLMWGTWGYKYDRPRLDAALDTLARAGFDYIRVLGVVGDTTRPGDYWDGREADMRWPDYQQVIAGLTDHAYDAYGLRVQWTLFGGVATEAPTRQDRRQLADWMIAMSRGREHKIIFFEIANESWQNGFGGSDGIRELRELSLHMKGSTDVLVAASAPPGDDASLYEIYDGGVADIATLHFDRDTSKAEGHWRPVRQPWEHAYRQPRAPVGINNEPIGPGSSVASEDDPVRLVASPIVTFVSNIPAYCFHSRAGVRGDVDIASMAGVTQVAAYKRFVPNDLPNWSRKNAHWADSPFKVYAIDGNGREHQDGMWQDFGPSSQGAVRAYGAVNGDDFVVFPFGVRGRLIMEPRRRCDFEVLDPMTGNVTATHSLSAGQRFELSGAETFWIRGRYR